MGHFERLSTFTKRRDIATSTIAVHLMELKDHQDATRRGQKE